MNPKIKTAIDEDTWILDITCKNKYIFHFLWYFQTWCLLIIILPFIVLPVPVLSYGPELLNPNDIEEGDAVFFLCNVYANPKAYKIIWKHNVSWIFTHAIGFGELKLIFNFIDSFWFCWAALVLLQFSDLVVFKLYSCITFIEK